MTTAGERLPGLQTIAERESLLLARYAVRSSDSQGRRYPESEHPYRGPFQRDRDRILHSAAYRRLSGKTQVFTNMGDYHRTRLTHTQEVASIARTLGRALRLNEDLIEALALFHDIGHPPYGHAGEDALNECLADDGGFSHNRHALTIVEELERPYQGFPGLNLTREVLSGQAARVDKDQPPAPPILEVRVVDAADSITYDAHDVDDALELGILTVEQLNEIRLLRDLLQRIHSQFANLRGDMLRRVLVRELIDAQVSDTLRVTGHQLAEADLQSADEARGAGITIATGPELAEQKQELETFLYRHVYRHAKLLGVRSEAQRRLKEMHAHLVQHTNHLPNRFQQRIETVGAARSVGEFLASMTDRHCDEFYRQLIVERQ